MSEYRMNHLGALGLLARVAVYLPSGGTRDGDDGDEMRGAIERCFTDAERLKLIRWRRVINRFDIEPFREESDEADTVSRGE